MTKAKSLQVRDHLPLDAEVEREIQKALGLIEKAQSILISSTLTSDGDSIGSQIGLYHLIKKIRKDSVKVFIVNETAVPERYRFLADTDQILTTHDFKAKEAKPSFDLGIVCDGGIERTGDVAPFFERIQNNILVDHHAVGSQRQYAARCLDLNSSSTCELVYNFYEVAGVPLSQETAAHLYVGMVFDTGFFKHSLTTPRTHHVAAELIRTGIDFSNLADRALLERTWTAQLLLKKLLENMERSADGQVIVSSWSRKELDEIQFQDGDQEGMINQLYFTEGTKVVALFSESDSQNVKISFRSKGDFNVAEFARSLNPQGGGHVRAAGCSVQGEMMKVRKEVFLKLQQAVSGELM